MARDLEDQLNSLLEADGKTASYTTDQLNSFEPPQLKEPNPNKPAKKPADPNRKPTKGELAAWNPRRVPMKFDWIPGTREKKARTRIEACTVTELKDSAGNLSWQVSQMETLGDRYETYAVKQNAEGRIACTCQGHAYGDTRMLCTHAIAGILFSYKAEDSFTGELAIDRSRANVVEQQLATGDEIFEQISASYGRLGVDSTDERNPVADPKSQSGGTDSGSGMALGPECQLPSRLPGSQGDSGAVALPMDVTSELVEMVEAANANGQVLFIDPWAVCYPARYELEWTVSQTTARGNGLSSAGVSSSGSVVESGLAQSGLALVQNLTEAHNLTGFGFDFSTTAPEDCLDPSDRESLEIIEEYRHRQNVLERIQQCTSMPGPERWCLPEHFTSLREHQWIALQQIIAAWGSGKKYVFLSAPTGSGKSILGSIAFLEWAGVCVGREEAKGLVCVTSKELQDQMHSDFGDSWWFAMIKGRLNYPTANFPERFVRDKMAGVDFDDWKTTKDLWAKHIDCSDCEFSAKKHCRYCDPPGVTGPNPNGGAPCLGRCPYRVQLKKLIRRLLGLVNTAYLLRIANSNAWGQFDDRTILVADEADCLEGVLMGYVTVEVSENKLAVLGPQVGRPEYHSPCSNAYADWFGWAGRCKQRIMEILQRRALQLKGEIPIGDEPGEDRIRITDDQRDLRRDVKQWQLLGENLTILMDSISKPVPDPWIYDGYVTDKETKVDSGDIIFKPVRVNQFGVSKLFGKFKQVLLESATLISADQIARDLGIPADEFAVVSVPRTFDPNRCPVNILAVADNSFKEQANSWPVLSDTIQRIIYSNPDHRVLVHAVSYVQAAKVYAFVKNAFPTRTILTHERETGSKKSAMERYAKTPGSVLISPSMARGSDLKGDLCRVQIIIKVPFGNLGDKQINARLHSTHDGQLWYSVQTIRELVQMCGRGMRSADDWCETWILDKQFLSVWGQYQMLFPEWWRQSVRFVQR